LKPYATYPILCGPVWGFAAETGLHAMRLICSGLFDQYPDLKIILGHLGEALPLWLHRMDQHWYPAADTVKKKPSDYIKENFLVTTSGMPWQPAFFFTYTELGADNILFAADYPYDDSKQAVEFMDALPINDSDKEKI